jgi:hypothetical protein
MCHGVEEVERRQKKIGQKRKRQQNKAEGRFERRTSVGKWSQCLSLCPFHTTNTTACGFYFIMETEFLGLLPFLWGLWLRWRSAIRMTPPDFLAASRCLSKISISAVPRVEKNPAGILRACCIKKIFFTVLGEASV